MGGEVDWITVAIQSVGAIGVCGMFIWYLVQKQKGDDEARNSFMQHLEAKDATHLAHIEQKDKAATASIAEQMSYMRERDSQSKEIAQGGHQALLEVAREVQALRHRIEDERQRRGAAGS